MVNTEQFPTYSNLVNAYKECKTRKASSAARINFEMRLGQNLLTLHREIHSGKYKPAASMCFIVRKPKPREIFAAPFRDRIVHHLVVSELMKIWRPRFNPASYACLSDCYEKLENFALKIPEWLYANRLQRINESKTELCSLEKGAIFLGFCLRQVLVKASLVNSGSSRRKQWSPLLITVTKKRKWEYVQRFRKLEKFGFPNEEFLGQEYAPVWVRSRRAMNKTLSSYNSMLGYIRQASSYRFRVNLLAKLHRSKIVAANTVKVKNCTKVKLKPYRKQLCKEFKTCPCGKCTMLLECY